MRIYITGIAGFIGFHVARNLKNKGFEVAGLDNFNPYYDPKLKFDRAELLKSQGIIVEKGDICKREDLKDIEKFRPTHLLHLAAQAGVRYSLENPQAYIQANIEGFINILEIVRHNPQIKLVYASSSSVYGLNTKTPFSIKDPTENQASLYGITKKNNEMMAANYQRLFNISATGLRYFTVYGPWGRPDMALFKFTDAICQGKPIDIYNGGRLERDFTYIDDIVAGTVAALDYKGALPLFNLGNSHPVNLLAFVEIIEKTLGKKAVHNLTAMQPGDVLATYADISESEQELKYKPKTSLAEGVQKFVSWYLEYYK